MVYGGIRVKILPIPPSKEVPLFPKTSLLTHLYTPHKNRNQKQPSANFWPLGSLRHFPEILAEAIHHGWPLCHRRGGGSHTSLPKEHYWHKESAVAFLVALNTKDSEMWARAILPYSALMTLARDVARPCGNAPNWRIHRLASVCMIDS